MAKNKLEITGTGDIEKALVQKSTPLMSLTQTALTLPELKILDVYLSRINSHDPEHRTVRLERGEIEAFLGVTKINRSDLEKRLSSLGQMVKIHDPHTPNKFELVSLFERITGVEEDGYWMIDLKCTEDARKYIFNIENLGYLKYRLKNITNLTSRYSYVLYLYLEDNRFRKVWEIDIEELKKILSCTAQRYEQFKFFRSEVLNRAKAELEEKTDLRFNYEPVKKGRKITAIRFNVHTKSEEVQLPNQLSIDDLSAITFKELSENQTIEWYRSIADERLTDSDIIAIDSLLSLYYPYDSYSERVTMLQVYQAKAKPYEKNIKTSYGKYIIGMIETEYKQHSG